MYFLENAENYQSTGCTWCNCDIKKHNDRQTETQCVQGREGYVCSSCHKNREYAAAAASSTGTRQTVASARQASVRGDLVTAVTHPGTSHPH